MLRKLQMQHMQMPPDCSCLCSLHRSNDCIVMVLHHEARSSTAAACAVEMGLIKHSCRKFAAVKVSLYVFKQLHYYTYETTRDM